MTKDVPRPTGAVVRPLSDGVSFDFPDRDERWYVERDEDGVLVIESAHIPRERIGWIGWGTLLGCVLAIASIGTLNTYGFWLFIAAICILGSLAIYGHVAGRKHVNARLTQDQIIANAGGLDGLMVGKVPSSVRYDGGIEALVFEVPEESLNLPVHAEIGEWVAGCCNEYLAGDLDFPESDRSLPARTDPFSASDAMWLRIAIWGTWLASSTSNVISILHSGYRNDFSALYVAGDLAFRGGFLSLVGAFGIWLITRALLGRSRFDAVRQLTSRMKHGWVASVLAAFAAAAVSLNFKPPSSTIDLVFDYSWFVLFGWVAIVGLVVSLIGRRRDRELGEVEHQVVLDFATEDDSAARVEQVAKAEEEAGW